MMGDKVEARRTMQPPPAVPVLPQPDPIESAEEAKAWRERSAFPVIIKAPPAAVVGMRIVRKEEELAGH